MSNGSDVNACAYTVLTDPAHCAAHTATWVEFWVTVTGCEVDSEDWTAALTEKMTQIHISTLLNISEVLRLIHYMLSTFVSYWPRQSNNISNWH